MKKICFLAFSISVLLNPFNSLSQGGTWVWVNGSDTVRTAPVYGIQGLSDINNTPGSLYGAANWIDKAGNLWLFGGICDTSSNVLGNGTVMPGNAVFALADLWRYEPANNSWTWMKGPGTVNAPAVYGAKGIPNPTNNPGAFRFGYSYWTDKEGDFWLYCPITKNSQYSLWRYQVANNEWTYINGSDDYTHPHPIYGTLQVPNDANTPGCRFGAGSCWVDNDNNLWFYGGNGGTRYQMYNDVWKYSIATNQWTWMSGPQDFGSTGHYGQLGVESGLNLPSPRQGYTCWTDHNGNFYMFGGIFGNKCFNDVWRYNTATNNWTWLAGDSVPKLSGNYSQYCDGSVYNLPMARFYSTTAQTLATCSDFSYVFAGLINGSEQKGLNDLWGFYPDIHQWKWLSGSSGINYLGNYGTKGVIARTNQISARYGHCAWVDSAGVLWIYGGVGFDTVTTSHVPNPGYSPCCETQTKNDLWKFIPDTSCIHITPCNAASNGPVDIFIPNAFSPNGDGVNDRFTVFGKNITQYAIKIFNRTGDLIYLSNDPTEINDTTRGWDGTYKGQIQPVGVYVYYIKGKNAAGTSFDKKGDITLIR